MSTYTKASIKGTLIKSWAARPVKFQWQKLTGEGFLGPALVSISPGKTQNFWEYSIKNK